MSNNKLFEVQNRNDYFIDKNFNQNKSVIQKNDQKSYSHLRQRSFQDNKDVSAFNLGEQKPQNNNTEDVSSLKQLLKDYQIKEQKYKLQIRNLENQLLIQKNTDQSQQIQQLRQNLKYTQDQLNSSVPQEAVEKLNRNIKSKQIEIFNLKQELQQAQIEQQKYDKEYIESQLAKIETFIQNSYENSNNTQNTQEMIKDQSYFQTAENLKKQNTFLMQQLNRIYDIPIQGQKLPKPSFLLIQ